MLDATFVIKLRYLARFFVIDFQTDYTGESEFKREKIWRKKSSHFKGYISGGQQNLKFSRLTRASDTDENAAIYFRNLQYFSLIHVRETMPGILYAGSLIGVENEKLMCRRRRYRYSVS